MMKVEVDESGEWTQETSEIVERRQAATREQGVMRLDEAASQQPPPPASSEKRKDVGEGAAETYGT